MPSTLTQWPVELRLVIYNHLITSCLRDGKTSDLAGVFLSCRIIYHDIRNEYMRTMAPLLLAKHKWETSIASHSTSLSISLTTGLRCEPRETKLHLAIPLHTTTEDALVSSSLECFSVALQPVFTSYWSEVSLTLAGPPTEVPDLAWHQHKLHGLVERLDSMVFAAPRMHRLVINFNLQKPLRAMRVQDYKYMLNIPNLARRRQFETGKTCRSIQRMWISRAAPDLCSAWQVSIDFVPHLEPPEHVLWMLQDDGGGVLRIALLSGEVAPLNYDWLEEVYSPRLSTCGESSEG